MSLRLSLAIARRLMGDHKATHRVAGPAIKVATAAVALGMVVMMVSVAVGYGFKQEIRNKIVGFGGHVQITGLSLNNSLETPPIRENQTLEDDILSVEGVQRVMPYIVKPGIIKTDDAFQGIALRGVDSLYDWTFVNSILTEGNIPNVADSVKSLDIVISQKLASLLNLSLGDPIRVFFVNDEGVRARRFTLCGIFESHFEDYDNSMAFVDRRQLAQVNNWEPNQITGYEILLDNFDHLNLATDEIDGLTGYAENADDDMLRTRSIQELQPQIFGWLALLDKNIVVILVLIIAVAGLNMVSGLLILILEHTNTIGILKAVGMGNGMLRKVFIFMALRIVGRGLIIGNAIGLSLIAIQNFTHVAKLDPENYYLDTVPMSLTITQFLLLNIGTVIVTLLLLLGPSSLIARISPAKSIRFN